MEKKESYTIGELFDFLPITIAELARRSGINEVTLARIRDGERTRRDTVNKLMLALSLIYEVPLSINNVTGINIMQNKRLEKKEARGSQEQAEKKVA
jgi:transcriptional regulator with XRE-family HTH domain